MSAWRGHHAARRGRHDVSHCDLITACGARMGLVRVFSHMMCILVLGVRALSPRRTRLVLKTLTETEPTRKCYRLIGGVLVERNVASVLPAVKEHYEGVSVGTAQPAIPTTAGIREASHTH